MKKSSQLSRIKKRNVMLTVLFLLCSALAGFSQNTGYGIGVQNSLTTGVDNSAFGARSMYLTTTGSYNSVIGWESLYSNTSGSCNTSNGYASLRSNTIGRYNAAIGYESLRNNITGGYNSAFGAQSLYSNTSGSGNTAVGYTSLRSNTTGSYNSGIGYQVLYSNTTGQKNTAYGYQSMLLNTTGSNNTASGTGVLRSNTSGSNNTGSGYEVLYANTTGYNNTAMGSNVLRANTTGGYNSAFGSEALYSNTTGYGNIAIGYYVLRSNITGGYNSGNGNYALYSNISGYGNVANGSFSLYMNNTGSYNTAIGYYALRNNTIGRYNTALGYLAGYSTPNTATNSTSLGYYAYATGSNRVIIGNTNVTNIGGQVGWSILSDGRFKRNISNDVPGIELIKLLKPVTYTFDYAAYEKHSGILAEENTDLDDLAKQEWIDQRKVNEKIVYTGFIAQEVEAAVHQLNCKFSAVVAPESEQDHYSLRYSDFVVPLVKAAQQQQQELDALKSEIQLLRKENEDLKQLVYNAISQKATTEILSGYIQGENVVSCSPNPTTGIVRLDFRNENQEELTTRVYNMSGNLIYSNNSEGSDSFEEINLSGYPKGTYIIETRIGLKTFQNKVILGK